MDGYSAYTSRCRYNVALNMLVLDYCLILDRNVNFAGSSARICTLKNVRPGTPVVLYRSIQAHAWTSGSGYRSSWVGCEIGTDGVVRLKGVTIDGVSLFRLTVPVTPLDGWTIG